MRRRSASCALTGLIALGLLAALLPPTAGAASPATPVIRLTPAAGPPTSTTTLWGKGFQPLETVAIAFDDHPRGATTAHAGGQVSANVSIPGSALPGEDAVSATGGSSGSSAWARFTVRTDWSMFHYSADHTYDGATGVGA